MPVQAAVNSHTGSTSNVPKPAKKAKTRSASPLPEVIDLIESEDSEPEIEIVSHAGGRPSTGQSEPGFQPVVFSGRQTRIGDYNDFQPVNDEERRAQDSREFEKIGKQYRFSKKQAKISAINTAAGRLLRKREVDNERQRRFRAKKKVEKELEPPNQPENSLVRRTSVQCSIILN